MDKYESIKIEISSKKGSKEQPQCTWKDVTSRPNNNSQSQGQSRERE